MQSNNCLKIFFSYKNVSLSETSQTAHFVLVPYCILQKVQLKWVCLVTFSADGMFIVVYHIGNWLSFTSLRAEWPAREQRTLWTLQIANCQDCMLLLNLAMDKCENRGCQNGEVLFFKAMVWFILLSIWPLGSLSQGRNDHLAHGEGSGFVAPFWEW